MSIECKTRQRQRQNKQKGFWTLGESFLPSDRQKVGYFIYSFDGRCRYYNNFKPITNLENFYSLIHLLTSASLFYCCEVYKKIEITYEPALINCWKYESNYSFGLLKYLQNKTFRFFIKYFPSSIVYYCFIKVF